MSRVCPGCVEFVQAVLSLFVSSLSGLCRVCPGYVEFVQIVSSLSRLC